MFVIYIFIRKVLAILPTPLNNHERLISLMTDKELRKLRRGELLDMLIYQTEQNNKLREELDAAKSALARREIAIENSGSLAEATVRISEIFESADRAAKQYLENIEIRSRETDGVCKQKIEEAERRAEEIIADATRTVNKNAG